MSWRGQQVLVTGADGFIGSHLTEALAQRGARVTALALYDPRGRRGWLDELPAELADTVEIRSGDVRDTDMIRRLVRPADTVFHLAALIGIPYSYHAPRSYMQTNAMGTLNVLEGAREGRAGCVLVVSTSEVYGTAVRVPIDETHPLQAQSPYAASKIAAEKTAESFYRAFDTPVVVVRPFNTYGPRQSARAVIPTVLMQLLAGAETLALGDTAPTRDFNYVDDTVTGMIRLAECEAAIGRTVNIGTGTEISIGEMAEAAQQALGRTARVTVDQARMRPAASEVRRLCADNALLKQLTGWQPDTPLEHGLARMAEWMATRRPDYDAARYYV